MTEILLIRHGETDWNVERRLQGHTDIGLNEQGLRQAEALGQALRGERLDAVIASDLQRALQTAEAVAQWHGLQVQREEGLRERCYGAFEGLVHHEISSRYPESYASWQAREVDAVFPSGERVCESFRHFYQRVIPTILRLGARHSGQRIALVAHGGVLECAYRAANAMPLQTPRNFPVLNASINRFAVDGGELKLLAWGDVAHLAHLPVRSRDEIDRRLTP